jgi:hypothetical protein
VGGVKDDKQKPTAYTHAAQKPRADDQRHGSLQNRRRITKGEDMKKQEQEPVWHSIVGGVALAALFIVMAFV